MEWVRNQVAKAKAAWATVLVVLSLLGYNLSTEVPTCECGADCKCCDACPCDK